MRKKIVWLSWWLMMLVTAGCGSFAYHRVAPGETLYSISWRYGLDYREVARWNGLKSPYTIYDGQQLRIAPADGRRVEPAEVVTGSSQTAPVLSAPARTSAPRAPAVAAPTSAPIRWQWPARGNLLQTFSETEISRKGIDIGGSLGEPVLAAAAGRVVYAGSGLLNYGKLIILKHDDNYLSAYAYNRVLRVGEGESVRAGQQIADMGGKGNGTALLHFEIRYEGRPMNPLKYLPSQRQ